MKLSKIYCVHIFNKEDLPKIAERLEQRADDDSIIPTGYIGKYSDMYNCWMKAGIIYYTLHEYEKARNCFFKSYNYLNHVYGCYDDNNNLKFLINLCDVHSNKNSTFDIQSISYSNKIKAYSLLNKLERNDIQIDNNLKKDFQKYIDDIKIYYDITYYLEILFNPVLIILFFTMLYIIN